MVFSFLSIASAAPLSEQKSLVENWDINMPQDIKNKIDQAWAICEPMVANALRMEALEENSRAPIRRNALGQIINFQRYQATYKFQTLEAVGPVVGTTLSTVPGGFYSKEDVSTYDLLVFNIYGFVNDNRTNTFVTFMNLNGKKLCFPTHGTTLENVVASTAQK